MRQVITLLLVAVLISGCATTYHQYSWRTGGYSNIKIQDDIFKVRFLGNAKCTLGRVEDFTLLRCAEVALENGYKYFIVIDEKADKTTGMFTSPASAQTVGTSYGGTYRGTTTVYGGQTFFYQLPQLEKTINCFKDKPDNIPTIVYDAEQIRTNIKAQYNLK